MYCDRWGRPLRLIQKDELDTCRTRHPDCASCEHLKYGLNAWDFEDPDSWPPDEPDPWPDEGCKTWTEEEYMQERLLEDMAMKGLTEEELAQLSEAIKTLAENMAASMEAVADMIRSLADAFSGMIEPLAAVLENVGRIVEEMEAIDWEEDRETIRPARTTEEPDPLLLRSRSLRELYGQGFNPGPVRR